MIEVQKTMMNRAVRAVAAVLGLLVVGCVGLDAATLEFKDSGARIHGTNNSLWMTPISRYGAGKATYVSYLDSNLNAVVGKLEDSGVWSSRVLEAGIPDDAGHTQTSLAVDGSGYIHVFYGMHADALRYRRSKFPNDLSEFIDASDEIPLPAGVILERYTYPVMTTAPNGDVYLAIRNWNAAKVAAGYLYCWVNASRTWKLVAEFASQLNPVMAVYPSAIIADSVGTIHMTFEWSPGGPNEYRHRGSYVSYNPKTKLFRRANGAVCTVPLRFSTTDLNQVPDLFQEQTEPDNVNGMRISRIAVDSNNQPLVVWCYSPGGTNATYQYKFARWDGTKWKTTVLDLVNSVGRKPWITFSNGQVRVYAGRNDNKVWLWKSTSLGDTFEAPVCVSSTIPDLKYALGVTRVGKDHLYWPATKSGILYLGSYTP